MVADLILVVVHVVIRTTLVAKIGLKIGQWLLEPSSKPSKTASVDETAQISGP
jgi:hypothetical protein